MPRKPPKRATRRGFGALRKLPSGRYQASYVGPDLMRHAAPTTFETRLDGEAWLAAERHVIDREEWLPPKDRARARRGGTTLAEYAHEAIAARRTRGAPLKPRTIALYTGLLERVIFPELGHLPMKLITPEIVRRWYDRLPAGKPTQRAHAYSLVHTLLGQAVRDELITSNPCQVPGAGQTRRARRIQTASPDELAKIVTGMPDRLQLLVILAAWCGLRYGELAELRRGDIDLKRGVVKISRAVVHVGGEDVVGTPKSDAGTREVAIPPHLLPVVEAHLGDHVGRGSNALLFARPGKTSRHLSHAELTYTYMAARAEAGRPDLRLHDLRHTAAVMAAQTGATMAELMARLGHSTPAAALRYQHAARGRDQQIAAALSRMALLPAVELSADQPG